MTSHVYLTVLERISDDLDIDKSINSTLISLIFLTIDKRNLVIFRLIKKCTLEYAALENQSL